MQPRGRGRSLAPTPFPDDDGSADPALAAALETAAADRAAVEAVVSVLAGSRVLVPVVAVAGETAMTADGLMVDTSSDMAVVTLTAPDGRRVMPVFSSLSQLAAWNASARPVPVAARPAALAAVDDGCELLVVDPAGAAVVVPRPAMWALAQGLPWTPSPRHPRVLEALRDAVAREPAVADVAAQPGARTELRVVLSVHPGLDRSALDALTDRVTRSLAASQVVAELVDSVELRVEPHVARPIDRA